MTWTSNGRRVESRGRFKPFEPLPKKPGDYEMTSKGIVPVRQEGSGERG